VLIILLPELLLGQRQIYLKSIVGQYTMGDLKQFQDDLISQYNAQGIPLKRELGFPPSVQVEFGVDGVIGRKKANTIGGFANYAITKGQLGYSDYSGETSAAQSLSRFIIGVKSSQSLGHGFSLYAKAGFNYSILSLHFSTNLYSPPSATSKDEKFHSLGFIFEPGVDWKYKIKNFFLLAQAGYEVNVQGKTLLDSNTNLYLLTNAGDKVIIDWSGFRLGLGIGFTIQ
jgi:hypothetical protein